MSADRWSECTECIRALENEIVRLQAALEDGYGKLSREDYLNLQNELEAVTHTSYDLPATLREDWEVGYPRSGSVIFRYSAGCASCNFSFSAERIITLTGSEDPS